VASTDARDEAVPDDERKRQARIVFIMGSDHESFRGRSVGAARGPAIAVEDVSRRFGAIEALSHVSFDVAPGDLLAVTGRSGSGKSTLLNLIGGLDRPDGGRIRIDGETIWECADAVSVRRELVGFVFQQHLLLSELSARGNVEVPLIGAGISAALRRRRALELLDEVDLSDRAEHLPSMLSGGECQRVAVARALANSPRLLLADEPTGALDSVTASRIVELLVRIRDLHGMTVLIVSYDPEVHDRADRTLTLLDGRIALPEVGVGAGR
jgi:putative ABC transport system ATP-binding protein